MEMSPVEQIRGSCPICGKTGLKSVRQHINRSHRKSLTETEYLVAMGIEDKECLICGRKGHESSYRYKLCPECLEKYGRKCPICGVDLVWHSAIHFSREHHCEPPDDMDELKLVKCNHCGKVLYPARVPCHVRERELETYCDDCLSHSFSCPSCGTRVFRGSFYCHLKSSPKDIEARRSSGQSLEDQFTQMLESLQIGWDWVQDEVSAASEYNDLVKTNASFYNEWRTGKTFDEIYGPDRANEIRGSISKSRKNHGPYESYWDKLDDDQIASILEKSKETRNARYGGYFSDSTKKKLSERAKRDNSMRKPGAVEHRAETCLARYGVDNPMKVRDFRLKSHTHGNRFIHFSAESKRIFDELDRDISSPTYHSENEWFIRLDDEDRVYIDSDLIFVDFYCPDLSLVIEFNGDYWHANPRVYRPDDVVLNGLTASQVWDLDRARESIVRKHLNPDHYFVLWETDEDDVLSKIKGVIANAGDVRAALA